MDYRPKFRFQWTWDGYNLIPLNPKAEEVLSRINVWAESGRRIIDGVHVGNPLSHSWLIETGLFPEIYPYKAMPSALQFRTSATFWNGKQWLTAEPTGINIRHPEGLNILQHPRLGVWMNDYKIDHRFGTID